jgi:hypothetical protein
MPGKWDDYRQRAEAMGVDAKQRWLTAGEDHATVGVIEGCYRRDQVAFGTVLGSAIALRLFLFIIPAYVMVISLVNVLRLGELFDHYLQSSVMTASMAVAMEGTTWWHSLWLFISFTFVSAWAGKSLARVLATSSGVSWGLTMTQSKQKVAAMAAMVGVMFASVFASSIFNSIRSGTGVYVHVFVWASVLATFAVVWFAAMLTLPRGTTDPGALIPGALLFGVGYTVLQWFMQFYLPRKIERTTDTFGQVATTIATLGNFFFVGRLMSASFVFTAVLYEQHGSLSHYLFELPGVRKLPAKFPKLRAYFALEESATDEEMTA